MMVTLTVITCPRGDWTVVKSGYYSKYVIYEGHDKWTPMLDDILSAFDCDVIHKTISDEDMEEGRYGT